MGDVKLLVSINSVSDDVESSRAIANSSATVYADEEEEDDEPSSGERGVEDGREAEKDDGDAVSGVISKRKKNRRGKSKKRRWKPYSKLTWDEKRELEDREARRAYKVREERFAHGQPVAPYNTTQFLMDDGRYKEPHLEHGGRQHRDSGGTIDSDEYYYSSPEDEEEFLQKEFTEVYDNAHAERLGNMTKMELIQEYIQLEERVEKLENKLKYGGGTSASRGEPDAETCEKIRIFKQEIRKLAEENDRLRRENERLSALKRARDLAKKSLVAGEQSSSQTGRVDETFVKNE